MTAIVERGEVLGGFNPKLTFLAQTSTTDGYLSGRLTDVASLEFQVFDISTDQRAIDPLQVFPVTPGDKATVNLVNDKLGTGRYAASYTVDSNERTGRHEVRWFYKVETTDDESSERSVFDVVDSMSSFQPGPTYASPADLKAEGISGKTDAFLLGRIVLASRYIERITGRFFEPRYAVINVDGSGKRELLLDMPIVAVESVEYEVSPYQPSSLDVDSDLIRIYNRHLHGLTMPDDRNNPKIEIYYASEDILREMTYSLRHVTFPKGQQNVKVKGVFGYTEQNGSMTGGTPELIRHVCKLLVLREQHGMADDAKRDEAMKRFRIKSEKTRDQTYTLEGLGASRRYGNFTGDPEIDTILASYVRPPILGAA